MHFRTVQPTKLPPIFRERGLRTLPAIVQGERAYDSLDEIIAYLDDVYPTSDTLKSSQEVDEIFSDFFAQFCSLIKTTDYNENHLINSLTQMNQFYEFQIFVAMDVEIGVRRSTI